MPETVVAMLEEVARRSPERPALMARRNGTWQKWTWKEYRDEIRAVLNDLREAGVDIVTLGQYLQPTKEHLPVDKFYTPDEFDEYREYAYSLGFRHVASGPLVRSSYHAERQDVRPRG